MVSERVSIEIAAEDRSRRAFDSARRNMAATERQADGVSKALQAWTRVGGAAALVAGTAALARHVRNVTGEVSRLGDFAEQAGTTAEAFQEIAFAANQYGVSQDAVIDGLKELNLRADEFVETGAGPASEAFQRIGLDQAELQGRLSNTSALFYEVIRRMEGLDRAARIRVADEIFGGQGGEQFIRLVNATSRALAQTAQEGRALGAVMRDDMVEEARALDREYRKLTDAATALYRSFVVASAAAVQSTYFSSRSEIELLDRLFTVREKLEAFDNRRDPRSRATRSRLLAEEIELENELSAIYEKRRADAAALRVPVTSGKSFAQIEAEKEAARQAAREAEALSKSQIELATRAAEAERKAREAASERAQVIIRDRARIEGAINREVANNNTLIEAQRQGSEAYREQAALIQILNRYRAAGTPLVGKEIEQARELARTLADQQKQLERTNDMGQELGFTFQSAFENAIVAGESFSNVLQGLAQDLLRIAVRKTVTEPLGDAFGSLFSDGFGSIFGAFFGGRRAGGGPGTAGKAYMVKDGAGGDEYFIPGTSGRFEPANANNAPGAGRVEVNVYAPAGSNPAVQQTQQGNGTRIDVFLDESVAKTIRPGTQTYRRLNEEFGLSGRTVRRA